MTRVVAKQEATPPPAARYSGLVKATRELLDGSRRASAPAIHDELIAIEPGGELPSA